LVPARIMALRIRAMGSARPATRPPVTSPWPEMNLVRLCITRVAPCSIGRSTAGEAIDASTMRSIPRRASSGPSAGTSARRRRGLEIASTKTARVFGRRAPRIAAESVASTKSVSMPSRRPSSPRNAAVEP
jgi:hypothetical protein